MIKVLKAVLGGKSKATTTGKVTVERVEKLRRSGKQVYYDRFVGGQFVGSFYDKDCKHPRGKAKLGEEEDAPKAKKDDQVVAVTAERQMLTVRTKGDAESLTIQSIHIVIALKMRGRDVGHLLKSFLFMFNDLKGAEEFEEKLCRRLAGLLHILAAHTARDRGPYEIPSEKLDELAKIMAAIDPGRTENAMANFFEQRLGHNGTSRREAQDMLSRLGFTPGDKASSMWALAKTATG